MKLRDDWRNGHIARDLKLPLHREKIAFAAIDWAASRANLGRIIRPIDQDRVDDYAAAFRAGAVFPRPLLARFGKSLVIVAGLHRSLAMQQAGETGYEADVVEVIVARELELIAVQHNAMEGSRIERHHRIEVATAMVARGEIELQEAAEAFGVTREAINSRLRIRMGRADIARSGAKPAKDLPDSHVRALRGIRNDNVLKAVVEYVSSYPHNEEAVRALAREVRGRRTEAQQIAFIEEQTSSRKQAEENPAKLKLPQRVRFLKTLSTMENIVNGAKSLNELQIPVDSDEEHQLKKHRLPALSKKLSALAR